MANHWPPEGYADPSEYLVNERRALLTSIALFLPTLFLIHKPIRNSVDLFSNTFLPLIRGTALGGGPLIIVSLVMTLAFTWIIIWTAMTIGIHEAIHYLVSWLFRLNPKFEWHWQFGFPNPSVVTYDIGIPRWQDVVVLGSPFILISAISGYILLNSQGYVAGTSAVVFATNTVPSGNDIYNVIRLVQMPKGTMFANFRENGKLRTEYIIPDSQGVESGDS